MRLLHTSDWHLGQYFHGHDRSQEHQCFLDWLLDTLVAEAVDGLLIAGDIYDQAHPAAETQRQFYAFLRAARERLPALQIIAIAGNHDSPARLEAPTPLLQALGIRVIGQVDANRPEQMLVELRDREGAVAAWCLAVPYLRPGDLPRLLDDTRDSYLAGVSEVYRRVTALALERRQPGQALIAMGHLHLSGGRSSTDSERRLVIGGVEALDASLFDPALAYVALGHLHLTQQIDAPHIRYCGSPLPLSFTEIDYPHQVLCVDLEGAAVGRICALPVPRPVPLWRVPAEPRPAAQVLPLLAALQPDPTLPLGLQPFVEAQVLLDRPEPGLAARIQQALAGKAVRFTRIAPTRKPVDPAQPVALLQLSDLQQLTPLRLLEQHYRERYQQPLPDELARALGELAADPA